jgi:nephrocystin-3
MGHEAFASSRLGLYIGGEKYVETLDAAISEESGRPVLVAGASGGGKSALLANWANQYASAHPEAIVLTHFLGTSFDAADPVRMAIRLLREIARITGEELVLEGDPRKALRMLGDWLEKAGDFARGKGGVFVLVLDALDKMTGQRDLDWWPGQLPEGVALVASCLDGGIRDILIPKMDWTELRVSPLERADCESFIRDHLAKYRKSLTPELTTLVVGHPLSGNPLFLRTLLEELRVFGVHEELDLRLGHYLASETIDDLFERVLDRIESDNTPQAVRAALEVLWAARESFAEDELLTVSGLPPVVWAPVHIALDESLIGAGGRIAFGHDYLRKAVEDRYLPTAADKERIRRKMADFCSQAMDRGREDVSTYVRRHAVAHFLEVEDWDNATAALCDLEFIAARARVQELGAMLLDYAAAGRLLPEGEAERKIDEKRQAELDRYAREMAGYAAA